MDFIVKREGNEEIKTLWGAYKKNLIWSKRSKKLLWNKTKNGENTGTSKQYCSLLAALYKKTGRREWTINLCLKKNLKVFGMTFQVSFVEGTEAIGNIIYITYY